MLFSLLCSVLRHCTSSSGVQAHYLIANFVHHLTQAFSKGFLGHLLRFGYFASLAFLFATRAVAFDTASNFVSGRIFEGGVPRHCLLWSPFLPFCLAYFVMSSKEVFYTVSQFIYNDILDSFKAKEVFAQLCGPSLGASPRIFFLCRFPGMVNTERFSSLFVVGEDEFKNIYALSLAAPD